MENSEQIISILNSLKQPRQMETVKRHFEKFPEPFRTQAIDNTKKNKYVKLTDKYKDAFIALEEAFDWDKSPEKGEYWTEFAYSLLVVSFVPKLKPVTEWFGTLPEPYASQALANATDYLTNKNNILLKDRFAVSPSTSISSSFGFNNTPEGANYWTNFVKDLTKKEQEEYYHTRTGEEWLKTLEEPFRSQALKNIKEEERSRTFGSLSNVLSGAFTWSDTPEGDDYWNVLSQKMSKDGR